MSKTPDGTTARLCVALHSESLSLPWEQIILLSGSFPCCGSATLPACSVTSAGKLQLLLAGCHGEGVRLDHLPVLKVPHGLFQEPLGDLAGKQAGMRKVILKGRKELGEGRLLVALMPSPLWTFPDGCPGGYSTNQYCTLFGCWGGRVCGKLG